MGHGVGTNDRVRQSVKEQRAGDIDSDVNVGV